MAVPVRPVPDGSDLQPQVVVFGHAVKVINHLRLVFPPDVVQVVEKQVGVAGRKLGNRPKGALVFHDVMVEEVDLAPPELFLDFFVAARRRAYSLLRQGRGGGRADASPGRGHRFYIFERRRGEAEFRRVCRVQFVLQGLDLGLQAQGYLSDDLVSGR